ncbi:hypothetical protein Rumeso_03435 [Rubellimicrobium mesophilum DSM 19309]|uniref:Transcriptional coactivator p15 (PC4) C-terminal domain-containing protein n=1 Tax=Rubellimicrobium mesophilum DSM 19309 TaxID=442562 RepID=A0A017HKZ5_9RHOB|nr:transcriptional coactivator p15/PC4 family protein [Rubellimicrobium mesophilum]EYD75011.1 hypothetical protein Rumeso_03435 [Rubellimicrobium mesophilum DSM 19309]
MISLRKNSREELRVSLDEFKGHRLLNLRVWFEGDDGQMRPGKQGWPCASKWRPIWPTRSGR